MALELAEQPASVNGYPYLAQYGLKSPQTIRLAPFADSLAVNPSQKEEARDVPFKPNDFVMGMQENYSVTDLDLHRCGIDQEGSYTIAQLIAGTRFLSKLSLSRNRFGTVGGVAIAEALKVNQTIRHLNLSWNSLRDDCAAALAEALTMNNSLNILELDKNLLGEDGAGAIATTLGSNMKIRYLGLSQNRINEAGCALLGEGIRRSTSILTLDLSMNGIRSEGIFSFASVLTRSPLLHCPLQTLNLSYNRIGSAIVGLGEFVRISTSLKELNLEMTYIEKGKEWKAFCQDLSQNRTLVNLSLSRNVGLGDGVVSLFEPGFQSSALQYLDLTDITCTKESLAAFIKGKKENGIFPKLRTLHLSENNLSGAEALVGDLLLLRELTFLGLQFCRLTDSSELIRVARSGEKGSLPEFRQITLRGNRFGPEGLSKLLSWISTPVALQYLDISVNDCYDETVIDPAWKLVFEKNPQLKFVVCADDAILAPTTSLDEPVVRLNLNDAVSKIGFQQMLPPLCSCLMDVGVSAASLPSAGFSTYSISVGSALKRQMELRNPNVHSVLFLLAGKPVKHLSTYSKSAEGKAPREGAWLQRVEALTTPEQTSQYEQNIGGLLVTEDQLRREFNKIDFQGKGYVEKEHLKEVFRSFDDMGAPLSERRLDWVLSPFVSSEPEKRLTFEEFCVVYLRLVQR